jgi:hypothetical protein
MDVDVEIYLSQLLKFFKENPKDLNNLVPPNKEQDFFDRVREVCYQNHEKGEEISLTKKQMIDICVEMNSKETEENKVIKVQYATGLFIETKFGLICLN